MVPSLFARLSSAVRSLVISPINAKDPALARLFDAAPVSSGVSVSEDTALQYAAVWAAVSLIASTVASLPLKLYRRLPNGGKEPYVESKLYRLLHDEPNTEMTAMVFRETLQAHVLTWGNGYAEIERDLAGRPVALWPIPPHRVAPVRDANSRLVYVVTNPSGGQTAFTPADMLHVPGLGFDGTQGYSPIRMARESLGLGLATERFGATFFGNGTTFGGYLQHPGKLTIEARQNIRESLEAKHLGPSRAHRLLLLQEGMTFKESAGIPPNDAQFLETRAFQIQEVARWFNLPPHKLRDLSRATFSNIEQQAIEFVTDSIRPWLVRWEQEINRKLIPRLERSQQFAEHLVDGLLRGDIQSRYTAYSVGRQWGWLSADDVRERENMNPLPGQQGQIYLLPMNMVPADRIGEIIDKQVAPTPAPVAAPTAEPMPMESDADRAVQVLRETLRELQEREATAIELAAVADARATDSLADNTALRLEAETALAEAARLNGEIAAQRALLLVAQEQVDHERAARLQTEAERIAAAERASAADVRVQQAETDHLAAERDRQQALEAVAALEARVTAARLEAERARGATETALRDAVSRGEVIAREADEYVAVARETETAAIASVAAAQAALAVAEARAAAAVAGLAQAEDRVQMVTGSLADLQAGQAAHRAAIMSAHHALIVDVMRRMIEREADRLRRAQATPEKLRTVAEAFYQTFGELVRSALVGPLRVHLAFIGSEDDPEAVAADLATQHVQGSRAGVQTVLEDEPEEVGPALGRLLKHWETTRVRQIADALMQKELDYATSRG